MKPRLAITLHPTSEPGSDQLKIQAMHPFAPDEDRFYRSEVERAWSEVRGGVAPSRAVNALVVRLRSRGFVVVLDERSLAAISKLEAA